MKFWVKFWLVRAAVLLLLGAVVLCAALGVVLSRHEVRRLFTELEYLERDLLELEEEWGRLLLEHGIWADHGRISELARERLDMRSPDMRAGTWKVLGDLDPARAGGSRVAPRGDSRR